MGYLIDDWRKLARREQASLFIFIAGPIAMMVTSFWSLFA